MSGDDELLSLEEIEEIAGHGFCPKHRNVRYCPDMCNEPQVLSPDRLIATAKAAHALRESEALAYAAVEDQRTRNAQLEAVVEAAKCLGDRWPHGCSDHRCIIQRPKGMGTNGGCMCRKDLQHLVRTLRSLDTDRRED